MTIEKISLEAARRVHLAVQGLLHPPEHLAAKMDVLNAIRQMGALQIDTIHVVARSPYMVLFSRLGRYEPAWLDQLLADGALFEYWSHAACFLPIEDYPLYVSNMREHTTGYYKDGWSERHAESITRVMQRLMEDGAVRSADFERTDGQKGSWWNWKEEKQVLEYLHTTGKVMIARRVNFQRVYDLRERVLPGWDEGSALPFLEARRALTLKAVRCLGVAHPRWVPDYFRLPKKDSLARLESLVEEGFLKRIEVESWDVPAYIHPDHLSLLDQVLKGEAEPTHTALLSPFDPLVWHRERARMLFGFEYSIECYLPEEKRQYGYYSLSILYRGHLAGRLDAKAHRKEGRFEVRSLHLEEGVEMDEEMACEVGGAIQRCAEWHATPQVEITRKSPGLEPLFDFLRGSSQG